MKNIIISCSLLVLLVGCSPEAEVIHAPTSILESSKVGIQAITSGGNSFQENPRDVTILVYPKAVDLEGFEFEPADDKKEMWNLLKNQLSERYRSQINENFAKNTSSVQKVIDMAIWINTAGEVRDNASRKKFPLDSRKATLEKEIDTLKEEFNPKIEAARNEHICYYAKRPRGRSNYACKSQPEGEFTNIQIPLTCDFMNRFDFVFATSEDETAYATSKAKCFDLKEQLDSETNSRQDELNTVDLKREEYKDIRDAGKTLVLDLLESVEAYSKGIFVSTTSNTEKVLDCPGQVGPKCNSEIVFSNNFKAVKEFKIFSSFGVNSKNTLEVLEYSLDNGGITDVRLEINKYNVQVLNFQMNTALFTLVTEDLSMTVTPDMGLRFVGKAKVFFKNSNEWRWTAVKLEFDRK